MSKKYIKYVPMEPKKLNTIADSVADPEETLPQIQHPQIQHPQPEETKEIPEQIQQTGQIKPLPKWKSKQIMQREQEIEKMNSKIQAEKDKIQKAKAKAETEKAEKAKAETEKAEKAETETEKAKVEKTETEKAETTSIQQKKEPQLDYSQYKSWNDEEETKVQKTKVQKTKEPIEETKVQKTKKPIEETKVQRIEDRQPEIKKFEVGQNKTMKNKLSSNEILQQQKQKQKEWGRLCAKGLNQLYLGNHGADSIDISYIIQQSPLLQNDEKIKMLISATAVQPNELRLQEKSYRDQFNRWYIAVFDNFEKYIDKIIEIADEIDYKLQDVHLDGETPIKTQHKNMNGKLLHYIIFVIIDMIFDDKNYDYLSRQEMSYLIGQYFTEAFQFTYLCIQFNFVYNEQNNKLFVQQWMQNQDHKYQNDYLTKVFTEQIIKNRNKQVDYDDQRCKNFRDSQQFTDCLGTILEFLLRYVKYTQIDVCSLIQNIEWQLTIVIDAMLEAFQEQFLNQFLQQSEIESCCIREKYIWYMQVFGTPPGGLLNTTEIPALTKLAIDTFLKQYNIVTDIDLTPFIHFDNMEEFWTRIKSQGFTNQIVNALYYRSLACLQDELRKISKKVEDYLEYIPKEFDMDEVFLRHIFLILISGQNKLEQSKRCRILTNIIDKFTPNQQAALMVKDTANIELKGFLKDFCPKYHEYLGRHDVKWLQRHSEYLDKEVLRAQHISRAQNENKLKNDKYQNATVKPSTNGTISIVLNKDEPVKNLNGQFSDSTREKKTKTETSKTQQIQYKKNKEPLELDDVRNRLNDEGWFEFLRNYICEGREKQASEIILQIICKFGEKCQYEGQHDILTEKFIQSTKIRYLRSFIQPEIKAIDDLLMKNIWIVNIIAEQLRKEQQYMVQHSSRIPQIELTIYQNDEKYVDCVSLNNLQTYIPHIYQGQSEQFNPAQNIDFSCLGIILTTEEENMANFIILSIIYYIQNCTKIKETINLTFLHNVIQPIIKMLSLNAGDLLCKNSVEFEKIYNGLQKLYNYIGMINHVDSELSGKMVCLIVEAYCGKGKLTSAIIDNILCKTKFELFFGTFDLLSVGSSSCFDKDVNKSIQDKLNYILGVIKLIYPHTDFGNWHIVQLLEAIQENPDDILKIIGHSEKLHWSEFIITHLSQNVKTDSRRALVLFAQEEKPGQLSLSKRFSKARATTSKTLEQVYNEILYNYYCEEGCNFLVRHLLNSYEKFLKLRELLAINDDIHEKLQNLYEPIESARIINGVTNDELDIIQGYNSKHREEVKKHIGQIKYEIMDKLLETKNGYLVRWELEYRPKVDIYWRSFTTVMTCFNGIVEDILDRTARRWMSKQECENIRDDLRMTYTDTQLSEMIKQRNIKPVLAFILNYILYHEKLENEAVERIKQEKEKEEKQKAEQMPMIILDREADLDDDLFGVAKEEEKDDNTTR